MKPSGYLPAIVCAGLLSVSCDEKLSEFAGPTPALEPTFSSIQRDIFNSTDSAGRRACTTCHVGAQPSAGLNLSDATAYASLVNVPSRNKPGAIRVIPGDPTSSYIIQKIEGAPGIVGERMPRTGGPYLTPNQITIIRRWIELGAPNN
jgi:Planctomycete cytochrome C.